jgi:drug/metabolite transporter (DMT)-like permease
VAAVLFALGAAALWGAGDFLGGLASRRLHVLVVLLWSQLAGVAGLTVWVVLAGDDVPGAAPVLAAAGAGVAGVIGLACLYRGMAIGAMGVVAPISATSPVVPLAVDVIRGRSPGALQWLGIGLALLGIVLLSRERSTRRVPLAAGVGLALVAAAGFGLFVVLLGVAAEESSSWATLVARSAAGIAVVGVLVATRSSPVAPLRALPVIAAVGLFDTAANALIAVAASYGEIGIVAVLSALYPLTTILLARLVLGERLNPGRRAGGALALAGAALVAAG